MHPQTSEARSYRLHKIRGASRIASRGPTAKVLLDKCAIVALSACIFALIVFPLLEFFFRQISRQ